MAEWKDIPGMAGRYQVSSEGEVRSISKRGLVPIRIRQCPRGYLVVHVQPTKGGPWTTMVVHGLVLTAFRGPKPKKHQCDHKDGVRTNNRLENLEWVTPKVNCQRRSLRLGGSPWSQGEKHWAAKLTEGQVRVARKCLELGMKASSFLARSWGLDPGTVARAAGSRRWKHAQVRTLT